ncbi:MAG: glycosyltransferase family 47 protein [Methylacidiphilales bacterium]|nr:glycosyltransferase family 47 protein [Candidatus Methylacidiphilales bacterium]
MARVYLLTAHPPDDLPAWGGYRSLKENAQADRMKVHQLVEDPEEADIILFVEMDAGRFSEKVRRHPCRKRFREKCFMFSSDWRVIPFVPGIYTSLEKRWYSPRRTRPGFYLNCLINPLVKFEPGGGRDLLYSFMGDISTAPVRKALAGLEHPRGLFVDTSRENQDVMSRSSAVERTAFWNRFVETARRSKFILCPRGLAPSSIRLFETMCMGRAPVILSDEWVAPEGPQWETFSFQIPERDARFVPRLLEEKEAQATEMGLRARKEWEKYFAPDIVFHRVVEQCLEIKKARRFPESLARLSIIPQLLRGPVIRDYVRTWKRRMGGVP